VAATAGRGKFSLQGSVACFLLWPMDGLLAPSK